ncbi:tetratricopeptide repeat protein [Acidobacteria bacterium AB60]|nr:tetratricopeptide repeat protein [Acidobacteria bacterium AB60]
MKMGLRTFSKAGLRCGVALLLLGMAAACVVAQQENDEVTPEVQQLYAEARAARQRGDSATAIEKYKAMLKLAPHLGAAYNNLGMLYFDNHDYPHAVDVLQKGLQVNRNMPGTAAMLGMSYFQLGDSDRAEPLLETALRANAKDDQVEMVLAKVLINQQKFKEASARLNDFLERNPKNQEAWYLLGKTYLQMSEDALKRITAIDPDSVVAHEIAGEIDESMHNYDLALVEYKKAVDKAPGTPGTHMHLGDAYWNIGKWQSAEEEFRAELGNDPNNCIARWKLANAMLEANDSADTALTELDQEIKRCPALMQAHVDRARALVRLGRHAEALPDLLKAEEESPREPTIHFLLAAVYRAQGKTADAQAEMQTYGKLQREASAAVAAQANDATTIKNNAR